MGLPRPHRLTRHADFLRHYEEGRKFVHRLAVFFVLPAADTVPRLGVTVSRKLGKATQRNRIKRRLREAWRRRLSGLPPVDVVVVGRIGLRNASFLQIEEAVNRFICWLRPQGS
jgi:ribonuclease P protein component